MIRALLTLKIGRSDGFADTALSLINHSACRSALARDDVCTANKVAESKIASRARWSATPVAPTEKVFQF
ncbi:hypothetical protein IV01_03900 [Pseudomonas syringae]|uniref:Uncharacterized protein n=1 Tax=Pseudomonas syringae TaxID=317 RepID=A0A085VPV9_PSESX|nr:hypothetical protein IV01_03900 [Pseudomonas syringae]